jgi:cholesterol transport system auxiliary component
MTTPQAHRFPIGLSAGLSLVALVAGCSALGGSKTPSTIYAPEPTVAIDPSWPNVDWQLAISHPEAARMIDTLRIAVRPSPGELEVYKGASWAKTPSDQLQDTVLHALEDSHKIPAVARQGTGMAADYTLLSELRRFEADYAGAAVPQATIEVNVKLLQATDQDVVATQTFRQAVPASGTDTAAVAQAFDMALGAIAHDIVGWTLVNGNQRQHITARKTK